MRAWDTKADNTAPAHGGILTAAEDDARGVEVASVVSSAGITLDAWNVGSDTDLTMLSQAVARYASGGVFATDSGAANAYVLSAVGSFTVPKALFKGMRVKFYPAHANSGASTVNAFGIGTKAILDYNGNPLVAYTLLAGQEVEIDYDPTLASGVGAWRITPWAMQRPYALMSWGKYYYTPAQNQTYTRQLQFTSIANGIVLALASINISVATFPLDNQSPAQGPYHELRIFGSVSDTDVDADSCLFPMTNMLAKQVLVGASITVQSKLVTGTIPSGSFVPISQHLSYVFIPTI